MYLNLNMKSYCISEIQYLEHLNKKNWIFFQSIILCIKYIIIGWNGKMLYPWHTCSLLYQDYMYVLHVHVLATLLNSSLTFILAEFVFLFFHNNTY